MAIDRFGPRHASRGQLIGEIEALKAENFALASGMCHEGYGDEYGNHRCRYQDDIAALKAENEALRNLAVKIRDDLEMRAEMDKEAPWNPRGEKIINMSDGLWVQLNRLIDTARQKGE